MTQQEVDMDEIAGKFYLESILNSFLEASEKIREARDEVIDLRKAWPNNVFVLRLVDLVC